MSLSDQLEFTGERFTPECVREIRYEHYHRYAFASELVRGRKVLDAACGEGYGSALLAGSAAAVTGVDVSEAAIEHARRRYLASNLDFLAADCLRLPFDDGSFERIVSFETLEHLADHDGLLREFRRVLAPEGFLLLSSPDKAVYSDRLQQRNEFHVRELYRDELEELLARHFPAYRLWGQKLLFQSAIWALDEQPGVVFQQEREGEIRASTAPGHDPVYYLAICAAGESCLPPAGPGLRLYDDAEESVYAHYYHEIRKNMAAGGLLAEKDRQLEELKTDLVRAAERRPWWRRLFGGR
jgi:SAM-dependent methyltransferase